MGLELLQTLEAKRPSTRAHRLSREAARAESGSAHCTSPSTLLHRQSGDDPPNGDTEAYDWHLENAGDYYFSQHNDVVKGLNSLSSVSTPLLTGYTILGKLLTSQCASGSSWVSE